ncbi:MAG TPA: hypothetical protein VFU21_15250 [Kofleriaceae bacterium]|nr:hypothetical protein [Kofleriaceae bacterium]
MNRRDLLRKLPVVLAVPAGIKLVAACTTEIDGNPPPAGGGGGGGGSGGGGDATQFAVMNADASGHSHMFWIECDQRGAGPWTYTAEGAHTHEVTISAEQLDQVFLGQAVTIETNGTHPHTWVIQMPSGMCPDDGGGGDTGDGGDGGDGSGGGGGGGGGW